MADGTTINDRFPFPRDHRYDAAHHMWARQDTEGRVVVGIDVLGLESLGDLAYVSLEAPGAALSRGEAAGSLEAAKMTGPVVSPVSGTVVERNDLAMENPALVNGDPYDQGWLYVVEPTCWGQEREELVGDDALDPWIASELERYREEGWLD